MSKVSRKDFLRKVSNLNIKSRLVSFGGLEERRVIFSESEKGLVPELIYADDECFMNIEKSAENFKVHPDYEFPGILKNFQHFDDSLCIVETKFMNIKCFSLWHYYLNPEKKLILTPVFILMNKDLVKISNIKQQFKIAA